MEGSDISELDSITDTLKKLLDINGLSQIEHPQKNVYRGVTKRLHLVWARVLYYQQPNTNEQ